MVLTPCIICFLLGNTRITFFFFLSHTDAPYDAIHVGAAAYPVPDALIKQLRPGGRLFIPVGPAHGNQWLEQIDKDKDGNVIREKLMGVRYVPLTDRKQQYRD